MDKNLILTSNYVRQQTSENYKKVITSTNNNNINNLSDQSNQQKNIMSRGISVPSKVDKDIKNISYIPTNKNVRVSRINIDSRYRILEPKNILDKEIYYLDSNPISINLTNLNYSDLTIIHKNHPFSINDNIVIQGVQGKQIILDNAITFIANSSYARINHIAHNLDFNTINKMYIEIKGFIGNQNNNTIYNNVPVNEINQLFQIFPKITEVEIENKDYYYINMISTFPNFSETYTLSSISIEFKDINGINLNLINANYPINPKQLYGFHTIYKTTTNSYSIKLNINNNISINNCGGDKIWVGKIIDFFEGYSENNYYKIPLKKTFYNVERIRLISTEFPNTEKVIKSKPANKKNNSFYWKLKNDGDKIYSVEIESGNYSVNLLKENLQKSIKSVKRDVLTIYNKNNTQYTYYEYNICNITIVPETDTFSIEFLTTIFIPNAIIYRDPINYTDNIGRLIINHPDHHLISGLIITIINANATDGIPQSILNNSFEIEKIIDQDTYQLKLPRYNQSSSDKSVLNGGDAMGITYPIQAKLYFDQPDTIGKLIGYRNVGTPYAITKFSYLNSNTDIYEYDYINEKSYLNNSINLSGDNYILMTSPIFKESFNTGLVTNVFAKLLLSGDPGSILYNQFIQLGEIFSIPIPSFSEWEVFFYDALGNLYNFGNLEHSYTLEIYEKLNTLT